jgi:hypothetical protein
MMLNKTFGLILLIAHCTIAFMNIFRDSTGGFYAGRRVNPLDKKAKDIPAHR